jgi:hypothetical protein
MRIAPDTFATFAPSMMVHPNSDLHQTSEQFLKRGEFTSGLHYVRRAMMMLWVDYHRTGSAIEALGLLRSRVGPLKDIYKVRRSDVCRAKFEMEYGLAAVLTADQATIETFLANAEVYDPRSDDYGFYTGFVGTIKGLLTGDRQLIQEQRQGIERFNATKIFYWPSKAVMFACLDADCAKLTSSVGRIEKKFTSYAKKMAALDGEGNIDLNKLDLHFFWPYPDLAFYALAFRDCAGCMKRDSFWLPGSLVEACGQQFVKHPAK